MGRKGNYESNKTFSDKAAGGYRYEGDGADVNDFFGRYSNYDELINNMDEDDKTAIRAWANGWFMHGQQYGDWDDMTGLDKFFTQRLDDVLDQSTLSRGVTVVRSSTAEMLFGKGAKKASLSQFQAMEGSIIGCKGNMSFAAASEGLAIGATNKRVEYRLKIPAGKGAGMYVGDDRVNGWGNKQREFIVNRDSQFRVGKTTYDYSTNKYTVELEYLGHTAHDYGTTGRTRINPSSVRH